MMLLKDSSRFAQTHMHVSGVENMEALGARQHGNAVSITGEENTHKDRLI